MTLHILINGREHFAAPYYPENVTETGRAIHEYLPHLQGRVVVFVTDGNVFHLIASQRAA